MRRPPADPHQEILSRAFLLRVVAYASLILVGTMAAIVWGLRQSHEQASTMAFMTLAFAQILHLGNARSERPVLRPKRRSRIRTRSSRSALRDCCSSCRPEYPPCAICCT
jgi:magnesium-transporting ATPase (P-type)